MIAYICYFIIGDRVMKQLKLYIAILVLSSMGCSQNLLWNAEIEDGKIEIGENSISKKFYTKDLSSDFITFLKNPTEINNRSVDGFYNVNFFDEMWKSLSEEEKNMLLENTEKMEVIKDSLIEVKNDTPIGRAILGGDSSQIDSIASLYSYDEWLFDNFGQMVIDISFISEEFNDSHESVFANLAIDYLSKLGKWKEIEKILDALTSDIKIEEIKLRYEKILSEIESSQNAKIINRASATVGYQNKPIRKNVGMSLADGTVILTCFKKKAFPIIGGNWAHAGIFSKDTFEKNGGNDNSLCIYTAQPDSYGNFPSFMQPDRPDYCCLDTISLYSYQKKMATLLPKNYTSTKAKEAVDYAKKTFYDNDSVKYNIPVFEFFRIGDTSHDMSVENPYCSKVVYSAWKKTGENLDSKTSCGNLISPDDLYGSAFNRYITISIRFFKWSKSWTKQIYSATSTLLTDERQ